MEFFIEFEQRQIETDKEGYLKQLQEWNEDLALVIADREKITMTDSHWEVVNFVRNFYLEYKTSPAMRALVKAIAKSLGEDKGNSRYLFKLFPKGPAKIATKIAGLPKPKKCL